MTKKKERKERRKECYVEAMVPMLGTWPEIFCDQNFRGKRLINTYTKLLNG
ncbi:MAG: hypothetical protein ACLSIL_16705 [Enterococcus casseliflavus]